MIFSQSRGVLAEYFRRIMSNIETKTSSIIKLSINALNTKIVVVFKRFKLEAFQVEHILK